MTYNTVEWFEIGTDRPEEAKKFYGELFGWTYKGADRYSEVTTPGATGPSKSIVPSSSRLACPDSQKPSVVT